MTIKEKTLKEQIVEFLHGNPGLSDREITNEIRGKAAPQQPVFAACKDLEKRGQIIRRKREDGRLGNYLTDATRVARSRTPRSRLQTAELCNERSFSESKESKLK